MLPSLETLHPCHVIKYASYGVENILRNRGAKGKCLKTFTGTFDIPTILYLHAWHMGQASLFACSFLYKMHPLLHASMQSYLNPIFLSMLVAVLSLLGRELGVGNITFASSCSISVMQAFVTLCVRHTFKNMRVVSSFDMFDPQYSGVLESSLSAEAPSHPPELVSSSPSALSSQSTASQTRCSHCRCRFQIQLCSPPARPLHSRTVSRIRLWSSTNRHYGLRTN